MPSVVRQRDCQQDDGTSGSYVVVDEETGEQKSCHKTEQEAMISASIRDREAEDVDE